jgi:DNA-binding HxlR family transcriptional regulator
MPEDVIGSVPPGGLAWSPSQVGSVLKMIGGRWDLLILSALAERPLRRTVLRSRIGSVTDKVLTETLRRMHAQGLIARTAIASVPVEVDYGLTDLSRSLWPVLAHLHRWAL